LISEKETKKARKGQNLLSIGAINAVSRTSNYILLAAATWLPGSQYVTGYVIYKFVVSVVG
jgi:hypothetical protein